MGLKTDMVIVNVMAQNLTDQGMYNMSPSSDPSPPPTLCSSSSLPHLFLSGDLLVEEKTVEAQGL